MAPNSPPAAWPVSGRVGKCWRVAHHATAARATSEIRICSTTVRCCADIEKAFTPTGLDRHAPEREPALQLGLDGQLGADLRLDLQLALDAALLLSGRGDERVPEAPLVVVDEVDRLARVVLEDEDGGEQAVAVAAELQRLGDGVDPDGEVLDVGVAQDHPAVAEVVGARVDLRAGLLARRADDLLHVLDDLGEV